MPYLADVNFLVALLHAKHAHSARAVDWLDSQDELRSIGLCRVAQMGTLRVLTNPSWLGDEVLPAAEVWQGWDRLVTDERFVRVEEPPKLEAEWRRWTSSFAAGRCVETDIYLATFARAGGYRVLTFDRGFGRLEGVDALVLE